jgi:ribosomal protein S18 acetylase RimI-like enzyme
MVIKLEDTIRLADSTDHKQLANLIHFGTLVHRHLDWRPPLEWIGHTPFLVLEKNNQLIAALACPPDPPSVLWIRLFVAYNDENVTETWLRLWSEAYSMIAPDPDLQVAAIPLQKWFRRLLQTSQFQATNNVVMLIWDSGKIPPERIHPNISIRPMNFDDLSKVEELDKLAFGPLWHNSQTSLEYAFNQAANATVADIEGIMVGYQISTAMQMGGHLARLATHPHYQRQGIGYAILRDLLIQFKQRGAMRITVNTQDDNLASIALYEKTGFSRTGETYPVYQYLPQ